ncbi:ATP-binding protein [Perlucidibaca piscinae]|uniref:ATP-binding protein n=1 Tax=Perlucidibaca piscinae TaxID=392589 RepID=UPI0004028A2F|nr:ATP-binding protein [Perlucidibaca piscinae]
MLPWLLHYRLLLAVLLPTSFFLVLLPALNLGMYRQDLQRQFENQGLFTIEKAGAWLDRRQISTPDLQGWLSQQLEFEGLRRITLLDSQGQVIAEAGMSDFPRPDITGLHQRAPTSLRLHVLSVAVDEGMHWIAILPDQRRLILTGTDRPQKIAFYERVLQYVLILVVSIGILFLLIRVQIRRTLAPLATLDKSLPIDMPVSRMTVPEEAREVWPSFAMHLDKLFKQWATQEASLKEDVALLDEELKEALVTVERQNLALHSVRRSASASTELKSEFLANISHEIRTPLVSLIGFARLLERTPLNERQHDHVNDLKQSAEHLLAMLNDMLDLSKMEAGRLTLDATPVSLREVVSQTLGMLQPLIGDKPVTLHQHVSDSIPRSMLGDPMRLKQIMTNLISNAIKFTPSGEVNVSLDVTRQDAISADLVLIVRDSGIGIPRHLQESLFDAFEQADTSTSRRFGGTGLGLTITRQLVELMGGRITVESQQGLGSTFTVRWQMRKDPFESLAPITDSAPLTLPIRQIPMLDPPLQVLVVDDHPANLKLMQTWLGDIGIITVAVDNGPEAIHRASQQPFDLVFMDIQMPGMSGLEAAQAIRANESQGHRVPIIALTAHALSSEREFWASNGIDDYVSKPLHESQLLHILQQWTRFVIWQAPVVDWDMATQRAGGRRDLAEELLQELLKDLPACLQRMRQAISSQNASAWKDEVHRLLGACRYCGVPELHQALEAAMTACQEAGGQWPCASSIDAVLNGIDGLQNWQRKQTDVSAEPSG